MHRPRHRIKTSAKTRQPRSSTAARPVRRERSAALKNKETMDDRLSNYGNNHASHQRQHPDDIPEHYVQIIVPANKEQLSNTWLSSSHSSTLHKCPTATTMSTTTMTMAVSTDLAFSSTTQCCPQCGFDVSSLPPSSETQIALLDAQKQIADLQAQVRLLNQKASAAIDRWADYEDELSKLRIELDASRSHQSQQSPTASTAPTVSTPGPTPSGSVTSASTSASPARSSFLSSGRLSALLSPRKSTPNLRPTSSQQQQHTAPPYPQHRANNSSPLAVSAMAIPNIPLTPSSPGAGSTTEIELLEALTREQQLRMQAEARVDETSREVEELSVSLFEQANEMVATERRARAKLEERVEMLEKRDGEKLKRLEKLESAVGRIERVRKILGEDGGGGEGKIERRSI